MDTPVLRGSCLGTAEPSPGSGRPQAQNSEGIFMATKLAACRPKSCPRVRDAHNHDVERKMVCGSREGKPQCGEKGILECTVISYYVLIT